MNKCRLYDMYRFKHIGFIRRFNIILRTIGMNEIYDVAYQKAYDKVSRIATHT